MSDKLISKYIRQLLSLRRGNSRKLGKAPHKPILILSILKLIKQGKISSNKIFITSDLLITFKDIWKKLVTTDHQENFFLPFFLMRSQPFWYLVEKPEGRLELTSSKSIKSLKSLVANIAYAEIDQNLFGLLNNSLSSRILEEEILRVYFNFSSYDFIDNYQNFEEEKIEYEIVNNPNYRTSILNLRNLLTEEQFEEELFIRGAEFKRRIPEIYKNSCCISKMKVTTPYNIQMIDACHIHPISQSYNDHITNGIALSPNLHRAFDRGLITINQDYIVRVSPAIEENSTSYSLSQFEGRKIILPENYSHFPSKESLEWHNKEIYRL